MGTVPQPWLNSLTLTLPHICGDCYYATFFQCLIVAVSSSVISNFHSISWEMKSTNIGIFLIHTRGLDGLVYRGLRSLGLILPLLIIIQSIQDIFRLTIDISYIWKWFSIANSLLLVYLYQDFKFCAVYLNKNLDKYRAVPNLPITTMLYLNVPIVPSSLLCDLNVLGLSYDNSLYQT